MPLLYFDIIEGRTKCELKALLDTAHNVVLEVFNVPDGDRYQIITEHKKHLIHFEDTGLGFKRTDRLVMLRVFTSPRSQEQKLVFMHRLSEELE